MGDHLSEGDSMSEIRSEKSADNSVYFVVISEGVPSEDFFK